MEEIREIRIENAINHPMRICLREIANIIEIESDVIEKILREARGEE